MLSEIWPLVAALRRAGLDISTRQVQDFLRAWHLLGPERENLLLAMQACWGTGEWSRLVLERIVHYYFSSLPLPGTWPGGGEGDSSNVGSGAPGSLPPSAGPVLRRTLTCQQLAARMENLRRSLRAEFAAGAEENGQAGCGAGRRTGRAGGRALDRNGPGGVDMPGAGLLVSALDSEVPEQEVVAGLIRQLPPRAEESLAAWLGRLRRATGWVEREKSEPGQQGEFAALARVWQTEAERYWWQNRPAQREEIYQRYRLAEVSFNCLDREQFAALQKQVLRLGRKLAHRPGYRYRPASRGQVDLRRSVAAAARQQGIPLRLYFRRRVPARPALVILCDVSGSVAPFSAFMLLLVYAMQSSFASVRTFAFVEEVSEITPLLRQARPESVLDDIYRQTSVWQSGFSDYGRVWQQFAAQFAGVLTPEHILLVLGDARNNYKPSGVEYMAGVARRVKKVYWLNPLPAAAWQGEDCIMSVYAVHCAQVFECRNLAQLARVAETIF